MKNFFALLFAAVFALASSIAVAKLPAPTPEAKAKADETKAKAAATTEADKKKLAEVQDRVAARYIEQQKAKGITVKPTPVVAAAPAPAAAAPAATPASTTGSTSKADTPNPGTQKVLAPEGGTRQSAEAHSAPADPKGEQSKDSKAAEKKPEDGKSK